MQIVIMTDIFGLCHATDKLKAQLIQSGAKVTTLDPYAGVYRDFKDEQHAYQTFSQEMGHDDYYQAGVALIEALKPNVIIGFSAGANVAWRLAAAQTVNINQIMCFYPSQIRHYSELVPHSTCHLILPNYEASFDVMKMAAKLDNRENLTVRLAPFGHGFMNPKSTQYQIQGEAFGLHYIEALIESKGWVVKA